MAFKILGRDSLSIATAGSTADHLSAESRKIINVVDPTEAQDAASKSYVDAGLAYTQDIGSNVETIALTAQNILDKFITLQSAPIIPAIVSVIPYGGIPQFPNVDFSVSGTTLSWDGLGLDGTLASGDILYIKY